MTGGEIALIVTAVLGGIAGLASLVGVILSNINTRKKEQAAHELAEEEARTAARLAEERENEERRRQLAAENLTAKKTELDAMQSTVEKLCDRLDKQDITIASLITANTTLQKQLSDQDSKILLLQQENFSLRGKVDQLEKENADLRCELAAWRTGKKAKVTAPTTPPTGPLQG